jgi:hypothetical protein
MDAVAEGTEFLVLRAPKDNDFSGLLDSILSVLSANPGDCDVALEAEIDDHTVVRIKANNALKVKRSQALDESLRKLGCIVTAEKTGSQILA